MSDSTKRAERRENEIKHWERRLEREFNNNGRKYVDQGEKFNIKNCKTAVIPDDLKNSKGGKMLKHTNYLDKKDSWKDAEIKNYYKHDRFVAKREIDNSIVEYNYGNKENIPAKIEYLKSEIDMYSQCINEYEELLQSLPDRLEYLKEMKKQMEEDLCWLEYGNN